MTSFDTYIGIDWSGAACVSSPSIAVASVSKSSGRVTLLYPVHHKYWSRQLVYEYILAISRSDQRIFMGIDANFSYAYDIIQQQIGDIRHVSELWRFVDQYCMHHPNFYAASFWENPNIKPYFWVNGKKQTDFHSSKRETEIMCGVQNLGHPESPFKLIGPKQVGKGGLAVMRMLHALKQNLGDRVCFWPFDTPKKINQAQIVMCEIYPRLFIKKAGFGGAKVRNVDQIKSILQYYKSSLEQEYKYSDHQSDALIAAAGIQQIVMQEGLKYTNHPRIRTEGWIFGL